MNNELYQQTILDHNKKPRHYEKLKVYTHMAEGFNQLCGDHYYIYLSIAPDETIQEISFEGSGCAISKASASLMTSRLKGKSVKEAKLLYDQFHYLITGKLDLEKDTHQLEKLAVFSGIWQYPMRVKCASLCWHTLRGALEQTKTVSTEDSL